eukprot:s190_g15.t2
MITDARLANLCFKAAPGVSLMTAESFGRFEVEFDDEIFASPEVCSKLTAFIGLNDVKDCFHRLRVPLWLSRYFAWEAVPAKTVGLENTYVDGKFVGPLDAVFPCAGSLCQGFSWSLYFAQRANEYLSKSIPMLAQARLLHDRSDPLVIHVGQAENDADHFYVYVDNLGVIGTEHDRIVEAMDALRLRFDGLGLELHGSEVSSGCVEALGCIIEGNKLRCRVTVERLWKVHQAVEGLLKRRRCAGRALEILVGHLTFCGLMCRASLSILHSVYPFIQKHKQSVGVLWPSIIEELRAFKGILFMLVQDWWRPWNRMVLSSDASLHGYGVCQAWWPKNKVAACGRQTERSRFKRVSSHSARESALQAAGFVTDAHGRWTSPHGEACEAALVEAGWETDMNFKEVPSAGLTRKLWQPTMHGRWKFKEDILVLEARAVMKGIRRALMTRYGHDVRQLALCDNLAAVLTFERCRSRNYKVLKILRQFGAYCFARNVRVSVRWIPSELNIADEGSRLAEGAKESKLLVDLLGDSWAEEFVAGSMGARRTRTLEMPRGTREPPAAKGTASRKRSLEGCRDDDKSVASKSRGKTRRLRGDGLEARLTEKPLKAMMLPESQLLKIPSTKVKAPEGYDDSESTSSEFKAGRNGEKGRSLRSRPKRGLQRLVDSRMGDGTGSHSLLEEAAVSAKVRQTYATRLSQLQSFVKENQLGFETDEQVDQVLVDYFNVKFKEGEGSSYGDYTMAALMDKLPQFGAAGWTKSASGMEMSPRLEKALPISLEACLSPQPPPGLDLPPLMKLRKLGLVRPTRGITSFWSVVTSLAETSDISKTGSKDDSVLIDSQWLIFANPLFEELARGDKMEFVFKFDYPSYLKVFREACRDLRLEIVPYQTRHSGPSIDRAKNVRTQEEVRKRGNWMSRKAGRLAATWQKLDVEVQLACRSAERYIEAIMLGQSYPVIPLPGQ